MPSALGNQPTKTVPKFKKLSQSDIKERVAQNLKQKSNKSNSISTSRRNRVKKGTSRAAKDSVKYGTIGWDD